MRTWFLLCLVGCAPDLRNLNRFRIIGAEFAEGQHVISSDDGAGVVSTQVQASDKTAWVYFDFSTAAEVTEDDPSWDLAFQRFKLRQREGTLLVTDTTLADVSTLPEGEWVREDSIFDGWYFYDLSNHTLRALNQVYIVETSEGEHFAMQLLNYYDGTGAGGYPAFRWKKLGATADTPAP